MYNQQPQLYTTRHYIHDPQSNSTNYGAPSYDRSGPPTQTYPYYTNNQQPTTVTYVNNRSTYPQQQQQQQPTSYIPPSTNRYPPPNTYGRSSSTSSTGGGGIEKTNMMSNENPFYDPARPYEQHNTPRIVTSITSAPKTGGSVNKTLNLSDENPFFSTYGGYHYPSQIDPSKRITTQAAAVRSTDNKSLNLSDENPFFSTYGRYHYPSQIDPQKRITEIPKAAAPLAPTNEMSDDNPFNNYRPTTFREYSSGGGASNSYSTANNDWNRNNNQAPLSYRSVQTQKPPQNNYNQQPPSSFRPPNPPSPPPPARVQPQKANPSAPLDKTSLNMSPDNPFAQTYGQYHYPSPEEIKAQKRANERNTRFTDQQPVNNNINRSVQPTNQMTEFPETEKKDVISGKGNTKFTRFDVNF